MTIALLHGIHNKRGKKNATDRLIHPLTERGYVAEDWDYGWLGVIGARLFSDRIAERVAERILAESPKVLIGHSNGCNIINKALWKAFEKRGGGSQIRKVIYISPALNVDTPYPPIPLDRVHVFHTERDVAVKMAEMLILHPWGGMGAHGARAVGYVNHDYTMEVDAHSAWFTDELLPFTVQKIEEVIR